MINKTTVIVFVVFTMFSCNDDRKFVEEKDLSDFPKTEFIPTLEHKISTDKNAVYCATLLFAWDEICQVTGKPSSIDKKYFDLNFLNKSKSHLDVLEKDEYESSVEIEDNLIKAYVFFNKSLPFEIKLISYNNKLKFNKTAVKSFGFSGYEFSETQNLVTILYYKNDDNFIIKLLPKDKNHEIVLFKSEEKFNTISEMNQEIEKLILLGKNEKKQENLVWKYFINEEDNLIIPKFNFNIKTSFPLFEGNFFNGFDNKYKIESVVQRNAFLLDESGAEIESEVEFAVEASEEIIENQPKPKHLVFDKPFLLLLKRTNSKNPYFGIWNSNSELMVKE